MADPSNSKTMSSPAASDHLHLEEELDSILKAHGAVPAITRSSTPFFSPGSVVDDKRFPEEAKKALCGLLNSYCVICPNIPRLIELLNLWMRSHEIAVQEFDLICVSLLVAVFLVRSYDTVNLQDPNAAKVLVEKGFKLKPEHSLPDVQEEQPFWFDLRTRIDSYPERSTSLIDMAKAFWRFWSIPHGLLNKTKVISLEHGGFIPRKPVKQQQGNASSSGGLLVDDGRKTKHWEGSFLVIQDPVVREHNHASKISRKSWKAFEYASDQAIKILEAKGSAVNLFGTSLEPPPLSSVQIDPSFGAAINDFFIQHRPSESVAETRRSAIQRVNQTIQDEFSRTFKVECFGSSGYGVDTPSSDLDLVIIDARRSYGFAPDVDMTDLPKPYNMRRVADALRKRGFTNVLFIAHATVPIVKFYDPRASLHLDINCNSQLGLINTRLIRTYCDIYPPLRPMIFFIKKWASAKNLNDPSASKGPQSFSSYCYVLMIVAFLQMKGVLPNLQSEEALESVAPDEFWTRTKEDKRVRCDIRMGNGSGFQGNELSLGEAIYLWFRYFGYEYKYGEEVISIRYGGLLPPHLKPVSVKRDGRQKQKGKQPNEEENAEVQVIPVGPVEDEVKEVAEAEAEVMKKEDEQIEDAVQEDDLSGLKESWLAVQDPFILAKNVPGGCHKDIALRFKKECQLAVKLFAEEPSIEKLLVEVKTDEVSSGRGGGRGGGRGRGRGRGQGQGQGPNQGRGRGAPVVNTTPAAVQSEREAPTIPDARPNENQGPAQESRSQQPSRGKGKRAHQQERNDSTSNTRANEDQGAVQEAVAQQPTRGRNRAPANPTPPTVKQERSNRRKSEAGPSQDQEYTQDTTTQEPTKPSLASRISSPPRHGRSKREWKPRNARKPKSAPSSPPPQNQSAQPRSQQEPQSPPPVEQGTQEEATPRRPHQPQGRPRRSTNPELTITTSETQSPPPPPPTAVTVPQSPNVDPNSSTSPAQRNRRLGDHAIHMVQHKLGLVTSPRPSRDGAPSGGNSGWTDDGFVAPRR